jgi:hypothetical protein
MQQYTFSVRRRLRLVEDAIRSVREECAWLRMQELQARLDAAMGNHGWLKRELDRRLEIIDEPKQTIVDL